MTSITPQISAQQQRLLDLIDTDQKEAICSQIEAMKPIEIVVLSHLYPCADLDYWIACADADLMMKTAYLWAVTGRPPYEMAQSFGLTDEEIQEYQSQWRQAGFDPAQIETLESREIDVESESTASVSIP